MLLELIEHQEELFGAIIAPLNHRNLCTLRIVCKALFATISDTHQWQHTRNFATSLRQIKSIKRAVLCDDYGIQTTIIYHNNYHIFYRSGVEAKMEVRRIQISKYHYVLRDMIISAGVIKFYIYDIKDKSIDIPRWLSHCILNSSYGHGENLLDLRC